MRVLKKSLALLFEPLGVYLYKGNWIVVAHCRLRDEMRDFRIDRMLSLTTTSDTFPDRTFSLEAYFQSLCEK